jgi:hypothetical protein
MQRSGRDVVLSWVPAHVGVPSNEVADEMAKHASINGTVSNERTTTKTVIQIDPFNLSRYLRKTLVS